MYLARSTVPIHHLLSEWRIDGNGRFKQSYHFLGDNHQFKLHFLREIKSLHIHNLHINIISTSCCPTGLGATEYRQGPADDHRSTLPARHRKSRSIELLIFYTIHDRRRSAVVCASTATAYNGRSCMSPSLRGGNGENRTACSKPNRLMAAFRLFA